MTSNRASETATMRVLTGGENSRYNGVREGPPYSPNDVDISVADSGDAAIDYLFDLMAALKKYGTGDKNYSLSNGSSMFDDDLLRLFDNNDATKSTTATVSHLVDRYVAPVIVVLGLIGNIISLIVFSERTMWRRSSSVYLAALSAVDIAFLTCVLLSWTAHTRVDLYAVEGLCQTFTYVTYVSSFLGVWYVVGFTVERYIAVHYPLRRQYLCTTAKARRSAGALATFAAVAYNFGVWTSGVTVLSADYRMCGPLAHYAVALTFVHAVDTVVTLLLPFVIISALNLRIAITVVRSNRDRRSMSRISIRGRLIEIEAGVARCRSGAVIADECDVASSPQRRRQQQQQQQEQVPRLTTRDVRSPRRRYVDGVVVRGGSDQFRVTKLLLTVSAAFLLLNLPRHALRTYSFVVDLIHPYQPPTPAFLAYMKLFQIVYYLQFAVNIILYATIGRSNFVGALRRIAHRSRRRITNTMTCARLAFLATRQFTVRGVHSWSTDTDDASVANPRRNFGNVFSSPSEHQMVIIETSRPTPLTLAAVQPDDVSHVSLE